MAIPKTGSKYFGLYQFLRRSRSDRLRLTFREIEGHLGAQLPDSAHSAAFWSNRASGALQAAAWMEAGYRVESIDLRAGVVHFERQARVYRVRREGGVVAWDAELLRALRRHLGMNQAGLAELLGVRQQTVSEWETGAYAPTRSRCKHLMLVAERAGFPYLAGRRTTKKKP